MACLISYAKLLSVVRTPAVTAIDVQNRTSGQFELPRDEQEYLVALEG